MVYLLLIFPIAYLIITILMCKQESENRKINFFVALLICLVMTPIMGYFIISNFALRNPRGCKWCNNSQNEAEYCGVCKKNSAGLILGS
ncbi:biotin transporter BioY [Arcicella sp. BE140]|nr:biotin transporter BioY [Arcicella sp. BE51]MDR6811511.1 biotin transporter BioY [Arcicella sp. BE140]MDR6823037.1 biotin transporter BioY [Arcicella sp. BE139]